MDYKCQFCSQKQGYRRWQTFQKRALEKIYHHLAAWEWITLDPLRTKGHTKRHGVIFTCMSSRAVHIEVANSLDTDSCINVLRCFVCGRVQVTHIRSDNGRNLIGPKKELQNYLVIWNQSKIQTAMLQKGPQWSVTPPAASHHGGVCERLIRMVSQILYSIL